MLTNLSNETQLILGNMGHLKSRSVSENEYYYKYTFDNGFGISIVKHAGSYGHEDDLWEIAVLGKDGHLCYTTPVTDDVIGWLTESDVISYAWNIQILNPDTYYDWSEEEVV